MKLAPVYRSNRQVVFSLVVYFQRNLLAICFGMYYKKTTQIIYVGTKIPPNDYECCARLLGEKYCDFVEYFVALGEVRFTKQM